MSTTMNRRGFLGAMAATGLLAAGCGRVASKAGPSATEGHIKPGGLASFGALQQIDAGDLNVGYAEAGPADGPSVVLLHGWPYDIHSFVDVAPVLAERGYRGTWTAGGPADGAAHAGAVAHGR